MKVLVAGIGNIFLSDDGFGSEVARRLAWSDAMPPGVEVGDFGIRGVHLAYQLLDGYDALVMIDAIRTGEPPGTITVFEPDLAAEPGDIDRGDGRAAAASAIDAHGMDPMSVLRSLSGLGGSVERVVIVGCEPETVEEGIGLSEPVSAVLPAAASAVVDLVSELVAASGSSAAPSRPARAMRSDVAVHHGSG